MITGFLLWLARHPETYLWLAGSIIVLALALAAAPFLRDRTEEKPGHDWSWTILILAILTAGRWPSFLFTRELNQDESQLLAGAHALTYDPVFWRSVNGGTAGPLNFFALWPAGWIWGWDSFFTARITALALLAVTLGLIHQCLSLLANRPVARLAILGAVVFEALTGAPDFLHFSTELVPAALLAAATYAAVRRWTAGGGPLWSGLGGLMLGAVPLAKLQAAPIAAVSGVAWLVAEFMTKGPDAPRHRIYLMIGACITAILFACQLTVSGEWTSFTVSYLMYGVNYVEPTWRGPALRTMWDKSISEDSLLNYWLPGTVIWLTLMLRPRLTPDRHRRIFFGVAVIASLLALGCIVIPGRPFLHYWQLIVGPLALLLGLVLAGCVSSGTMKSPTARYLAVGGAALILAGMLYHRARTPNPFLEVLDFLAQNPRTDLALRIATHARPGEALALWGRADNLYVETGLRQATRDPHVGSLLEPGPQQEYYRRRYLADLQFTKPALFVDCIGLASLDYHQPEQAHDRNFPELAAVIRADYVLVEEFKSARIYRRKDLVGH